MMIECLARLSDVLEHDRLLVKAQACSDLALDLMTQPGRERDANVISREGARLREEAAAIAQRWSFPVGVEDKGRDVNETGEEP